MQQSSNHFCGRTRREFLWNAGAGFAGLALTDLLSQDGFLNHQTLAADGITPYRNPLEPKQPQFKAKAKSVIFLFMYGGPSHVDTFDYKPELFKHDAKTIQIKTFGRGGKKNKGRVVGPKWKFKQYGKSGQWFSSLFPHLAQRADDITFLKSMQAESPIHGSAMLMMNSGRLQSGFPSLGAWANYGLGTQNENLPGYVVMLDNTGGPISGAKNWSSGFMPASYQGTTMKDKGSPVLNLNRPKGMSQAVQRELIDSIKEANQIHLQSRQHNTELEARIASYELAFKMQKHAPEAADFSQETKQTHEMYGLNKKKTNEYGRKCLLARRLVERGVRYIQIYAGGNHSNSNWDAHGDLVKNHSHNAGRTDQPIAALLKDLKQRGLLDETLVVWGGEFGRQPTAEYAKGTGRDHNSWGFTMWMAGGGIKPGISYGATDELGSQAVENPTHVKRLHATILHQMGLDPNRLSFFHGGLDQKLVGVEKVEPIHEIIA